MLRPYTPLSWRLIWEWSFELLRMMAWWMATYVSLHFMYHRAISLQSGVVRFDLATMLGLCFALFGSFFVQYYVFYGIPILFANIDQIKSPTRPKCVFSIAKSSELWRTFDGGLYDFMKKFVASQYKRSIFTVHILLAITFPFFSLQVHLHSIAKTPTALNLSGQSVRIIANLHIRVRVARYHLLDILLDLLQFRPCSGWDAGQRNVEAASLQIFWSKQINEAFKMHLYVIRIKSHCFQEPCSI